MILAIAAPTAVFAAVGTPSGGGDTITWNVSASGHTSIELRVSCAGDVQLSKSFNAGKPVTLSVRDFPGDTVENGTCTWEMFTVPFIPSGVAKQLANARAAGDDKAASKILKAAGISSSYDSGSLQVENNSFVTVGGSEGQSARTVNTDGSASSGTSKVTGPAGRFTPTVQDQVIPDDLIVQGSACVGLDCVNNESFGFDTIRLKENNTRIKFDDTSTSAGFPANDWQLTANDSASGGSSKFSIEDITGSKVPFTVTAGASTNSIFVDSTGRIGARTSTPVLDFHINTSNTPAIRLEQNNSGGFTAQTWDVAGNEANFFVRDVTGGSKLSFRIRPGAPTSSIDISADGDVGIGTASPNANTQVDVNSSDQLKARIALTGQEFFQASNTSTDGIGLLLGVNRSGNRQLWIADTSLLTQNGTNKVLRFQPNGGAIDAITTNGTGTANLILNQGGGFIGIGVTNPTQNIQHSSGATLTGGNWTNASSRTYKQDIHELDSTTALEAFKHLNPVTYAYKSNPNDQQVGFIAEDVPEIVATPDHKGLSAMDVVAVLTKVVQEQQKTIDELSKKVDELQKQN